VDSQAQRLDALAQRLGGPARALGVQQQALDVLQQRLRRALGQPLAAAPREMQHLAARLLRAMAAQRQQQALRLQAAAQRLSALNPQRVLARGYAWMADADGKPVVSARAVRPGQRLGAVWSDGAAQVEVLHVDLDAQGP
jgi:exodeoxyribonuclease VII large subunit